MPAPRDVRRIDLTPPEPWRSRELSEARHPAVAEQSGPPMRLIPGRNGFVVLVRSLNDRRERRAHPVRSLGPWKWCGGDAAGVAGGSYR
jgi:hypothetical protein